MSGEAENTEAMVPNRFEELEVQINTARTAAIASLAIFEAMRDDSNEIADSILSKTWSKDSPIREYWPLTRFETIQPRPGDVGISKNGLVVAARTGESATPETDLASEATLFWTDYFDADLAGLYRFHPLSSSKVRARLVVDLETWATKMAERGWPLIFSAELRDPILTSVWVNQDNPQTRQQAEENASKGIKYIDRKIRQRGLPEYVKHRAKRSLTGRGQTSIRTGHGYVDFTDRKTKKLIETWLEVRHT